MRGLQKTLNYPATRKSTAFDNLVASHKYNYATWGNKEEVSVTRRDLRRAAALHVAHHIRHTHSNSNNNERISASASALLSTTKARIVYFLPSTTEDWPAGRKVESILVSTQTMAFRQWHCSRNFACDHINDKAKFAINIQRGVGKGRCWTSERRQHASWWYLPLAGSTALLLVDEAASVLVPADKFTTAARPH